MVSPALIEIGPTEKLLLSAGLWAAAGEVFSGFDTQRENLSKLLASEEVVSRALNEKMLPMLLEFAHHHGEYLPDEIEHVNEVFRLTTEILFQGVSEVIEASKAAGLEIMVLKGGDLSLTAFPQNLPRMMNDLDVMMKPPDLATVIAAFTDAGYVQGRLDRSKLQIIPLRDEEKIAIATDHYELAPFLKVTLVRGLTPFITTIRKYLREYSFVVIGEDVYFVEEYDLHFNLSSDFDVEDVWHSPRRIELPTGQKVLAQSATDLLWFLAARAYHQIMLDAKPSLRLFVDVLATVHSHGPQVDWDRLMHVAEKYKLHPSLLYMFWHVNELLGPVIPQKVLDFCDAEYRALSRFHDWGDFMPKLMGCTVVSSVLAPDGG